MSRWDSGACPRAMPAPVSGAAMTQEAPRPAPATPPALGTSPLRRIMFVRDLSYHVVVRTMTLFNGIPELPWTVFVGRLDGAPRASRHERQRPDRRQSP